MEAEAEKNKNSSVEKEQMHKESVWQRENSVQKGGE